MMGVTRDGDLLAQILQNPADSIRQVRNVFFDHFPG
jgi:hypothetical protein